MTTGCAVCGGEDPCRGGWVDTGRGMARCERWQAALAAAWGVPRRFAGASMDGMDARHPRVAGAVAAAREYVQALEPGAGDGLLLHGPPGTGKTHLAAAVLHALADRGVRGRFIDFTAFTASLQASFDDPATPTEAVVVPVLSAPVLVVDELGAQKPTEWVLSVIYRVVNTRYNELLPTIYTTNYPPRQGPRPVGDRDVGRGVGALEPLAARVGERIVSRLAEACREVDLAGAPDRRRVVR